MRAFLLAAVGAAAVAPLAGSSVMKGPTPVLLAWAPGPEIAFGARSGGKGAVYLIRPDGSELHKILNLDANPVWSPDGKRLLLSGGGPISTVRPDGSGLHRLGPGSEAVWAPNGARIAFYDSKGLSVMNADGSGRHVLAKATYSSDTGPPAWSPDSRRVAFIACTAPDLSYPCEHQTGFDVYTVNAAGGTKRRITHAGGYDQCLAWSSAGKMAFNASNGLAIVQPDGRLRTFTIGGCPAWAPGGHRLATCCGGYGPALLSADGSGRRVLHALGKPTYALGEVVWSPDGRRLAFQTESGGSNSKVYVVGADGRGAKQILP